MDWYVVHTKPRQEHRALLNLEQQGYECYLPVWKSRSRDASEHGAEGIPLFPRYLFIRLDDAGAGKSWSPIRSTLGVSRLVTFGTEPARVDSDLIQKIRQDEMANRHYPPSLFTRGQHVLVTKGPFSGIEAVYEMDDGDSRAVVLIELLSRPTALKVGTAILRRIP